MQNKITQSTLNESKVGFDFRFLKNWSLWRLKTKASIKYCWRTLKCQFTGFFLCDLEVALYTLPTLTPYPLLIMVFRLLGAPVESVEFCSNWLSTQQLTKCIHDPNHWHPPTQLHWGFFYRILYKKSNHLLRCPLPDTLRPYLDNVDLLLKDTFQLILGCLMTPVVWSQYKTSIIKGGLGIPDVHLIDVAAPQHHVLKCFPI